MFEHWRSFNVWSCASASVVRLGQKCFMGVPVGKCLTLRPFRVLSGTAHGSATFVSVLVDQCLAALRSFTEPYPLHATVCVGVWRLNGVAWDTPAAQM